MTRDLKPTMKDVARLAGVSTMTVSRVLADGRHVAAETRARVDKAIVKLGYVPDRVAGSLSSRRSGFIAVIVPTLTNSNFADTAVGLTEVLREDGFQILLGYTMYDVTEEERIARSFLARRPEAMVVVGDQHTKAMRRLLLNAGIPTVEIWSNTAQPIDHTVGFSNEDVGRAAARYLVSLGHRRLGAIAPLARPGANDHRGEMRLAGFRSYLVEVGLPTDLVIKHGEVPFSFEQGGRAMRHLLDSAPDLDAVFLISDLGCVGALMECQRRGIRVPDDISLMGFGGFEIGEQCVPSLTTIGIDAVGLGRETGKLLMKILAERGGPSPTDPPACHIDIGFTLTERESTRNSVKGPCQTKPA